MKIIQKYGGEKEKNIDSSLGELAESYKDKINHHFLSVEHFKNYIRFLFGTTSHYWEYSNGRLFHKKDDFHYLNLFKALNKKNTYGFSPFIDSKNIMFAGLDFDAHFTPEEKEQMTDEEKRQRIDEAQNDSQKVYNFLNDMGLPVIQNSSGSDGRHVRLYWGNNAKDARIFLHWACEQVKIEEIPEIFPKQNDLNEDRLYGNQMKGLLHAHPKYKKCAGVIKEGEVLDVVNSINEINSIMKTFKAYNPTLEVKMPQEDYDRIEQEYDETKKINAYLDKTKTLQHGDYEPSIHDTPNFCPFFEHIAIEHLLPSVGRYERHKYLDPSASAYFKDNDEGLYLYLEKQGRNDISAVAGWAKRNIPFSCRTIIKYLKNVRHKSEPTKEGLKLCQSCSRFKDYMRIKNEPRGLATRLIISKIGEEAGYTKCKKCDCSLTFNDDKGYAGCKKCKKWFGITKFIHMCEQQAKEQEATK